MLTLWGIFTLATVVGGLQTVVGLWLFERRRARRRNRDGECAACGTPWASIPSVEPFLIHGRLVCDGCAAKARRRMPWHFGMLGLTAGVGTAIAFAGADVRLMVLAPMTSTVAMTLGAVAWMKHVNRRAQRRIASGEFPDMEAIRRELAPVHGGRQKIMAAEAAVD